MRYSLVKKVFFLCSGIISLLNTSTACNNNPWSVQLTASTTPIYDEFSATFEGSSDDDAFSLSITSNAGTVTQGNRTTQVVVDAQIPWSPQTLYAIIGADSTGIMMGWVYCQGASLTSLWLEDTTGTAGFTSSTVTGSCVVTSSAQTVDLITPDECVAVRPPPSYPTIDGGSELSLQPNSVGNVVLANDEYTLIPFTIVDCTSCTSSGVNGGWFEVHSVMASTTSANVCLGIFYLPVIHTPTIALDYVNCFEENVGDQTFNATYEIPANLEGAIVKTTVLSEVPDLRPSLRT